MVDLVVLQSASYVAAAIGVCVAAAYYVMTLRVQQANMREAIISRRATFSSNQSQYTCSEEWLHMLFDVIHMRWSDFEDFKKRYDSSANTQFFAKRASVLSSFNALGQQYRNGIISLDAFDSLTSFSLVLTWLKFKPIIEGYRGWQYPKDALSDFEYLANALQKRLGVSDPSFMEKMNTFFTTPPANQ